MQILYNSDNFAVVRIDLHTDSNAGEAANASLAPPNPSRGGYEIVDKFARKEIFLQGVMAEQFKQGVDELIQTGPTEEEFDAFIERYASLMQQRLTFH